MEDDGWIACYNIARLADRRYAREGYTKRFSRSKCGDDVHKARVIARAQTAGRIGSLFRVWPFMRFVSVLPIGEYDRIVLETEGNSKERHRRLREAYKERLKRN